MADNINIKFTYEVEPCTRCGGSGRYSFCAMYGDKCFKCGDSGQPGKQLTKTGFKAKAALEFARACLLATPVSTLKIGDVINANTRGYGKACRLTITEISEPAYTGCGFVGTPPAEYNACKSIEESIAWILANPGRGGIANKTVTITGKAHAFTTGADSCVQRMPNMTEIKMLRDFALSLPGVTVTETLNGVVTVYEAARAEESKATKATKARNTTKAIEIEAVLSDEAARAKLAAMPTPIVRMQWGDNNALTYCEWMLKNAGARGRAKVSKFLRTALA